jgi:purine-cytosine permease-like protein
MHAGPSPDPTRRRTARPFGIERAGAEPVPAGNRHVALWFGASVQFATLIVGALSTSVFGLAFLPAALAVTIGTLLPDALAAVRPVAAASPVAGALGLLVGFVVSALAYAALTAWRPTPADAVARPSVLAASSE